jgi:hypothetical protein
VTVLRLLSALGGVILIVLAFAWAMQVLTVKNAEPPPLARLVFRGVRSVMYALGNFAFLSQRRQQIWALYVSVSLLAIVGIAVGQILVGYTFVFYGISSDDLRTSYINSVSSLSVLGFGGLPGTLAQSTIALAEAFTGPIFVALLISYLANVNSSVSQRQSELRSIEVKVGAARSGPELLERALDGPGLSAMTEIWQDWTREFVQAKASISTVEGYLLVYSPGMHSRWITDAQAVLDAASFRNSIFDLPDDPEAARCLVEGASMLKQAASQSHHALLRIHRPGPHRIVTREQFDSVCAELAKRNAPITANRDAAWAKFVQYRATYDESVFRLGQMMNVAQSDWP